MKTEMNTLNKNYFLILFFTVAVSSCYSEKDKYLREAIQWDAIVCPLIHAKDSASILLDWSAQSLVDEIKSYSNITNAEEYLYKSIKNHSSIQVSDTFYNASFNYRVRADSIMDEIYMIQGIDGLLNKYFKKEKLFGGVLILRNLTQMFPLRGSIPYPAFGENTNVGYMAYLLSKHNIYLSSVWIDEDGILMTVLNEELSDMNELKIKK